MKGIFAVFAVAFSGFATAQPQMQPGLYDVKMRMNMPGMPAMPEQTHRMCITPEDISDNPGKASMPSEGMPADCEFTDHNISGNTASWKMRCSGANAMQAEGQTNFSDDGYTGTIKMTGDFMQTGQPMSMTQNLSATRIGDCSESSIPR